MTCNSHECGALWQPDPDGEGSHRADQAAQAPREAARMWRPATLSGVEVLHAFKVVGSETGEKETIPYDVMHATPVMRAPDFVKQSPLALADNPLGWAQVDEFTMQSPDFPNVFALGDAGSTPNSETGAAIRRQATDGGDQPPGRQQGKEPTAKYDGYASCPLVTAHNKMLLAEFDYDLRPAPSIPLVNAQKERYDMYLRKRYGLPFMYWNGRLRGVA